MNTIATSVVICGAGPVGLTLAHLLGMEGVDCVVLDRLEGTVSEPRAIAIDGESLRTLQKLGLLEGILDEFLCGLEADYVNGEGRHLFKVGRPEYRPYGYSMINAFDQPTLDRYLADTLRERASVRLLFAHELTGFEQGDDGVTVHCRNPQGQAVQIMASYLVGCDGGRSSVRSQLHIAMRGESNAQPWLVIDTRDSHLGDELDCRFYCDPKRPGMTIRKRHGERRWEWMLMPGEAREDLLDDDTIRALIAPYTDVDNVEVYRKRVYDFHAIIADRWREGRVFLAGDAAHMTPPFAGQGLNSGLRDASNLGWKLALVVKGLAGADLLDSYEKDRRDHAWELIETALQLGRQIQPIDPAQAAERDAAFARMHEDPAALQALEDEMAKSVLARRVTVPPLPAGECSNLPGSLLVQPTVTTDGKRALLDEYLGGGFAILGVNCDPVRQLSERLQRDWTALGARLVQVRTGLASAGAGIPFDHTHALADWLGGDQPVMLLIRPDRFCMAAATPDSAEHCLRQAFTALVAGDVTAAA